MSDSKVLEWTENWKRSYRFIIGERSFLTSQYLQTNAYAPPPQADDSDTTPSNHIILTNIEPDTPADNIYYDPRGISFSFDGSQYATSTSGTDYGTLELYNINKELDTLLHTDTCMVIIEAGYQGKAVTAWCGDVMEVEPHQSSADTIYSIEIAPAALAMRNTVLSLNYDEDQSAAAVVKELCSRFSGIGVGRIHLPENLSQAYRTGGYTYQGTLVQVFNQVCHKYGLKYSINNNKINVFPANVNLSPEISSNPYYLTEDLLKSLKNISKNKTEYGSGDKAQSSARRIQINTYFIPVEIGEALIIPTSDKPTIDNYSGTWIVQDLRTVLSDRVGGGFDVVCQCVEAP